MNVAAMEKGYTKKQNINEYICNEKIKYIISMNTAAIKIKYKIQNINECGWDGKRKIPFYQNLQERIKYPVCTLSYFYAAGKAQFQKFPDTYIRKLLKWGFTKMILKISFVFGKHFLNREYVKCEY